jgi:hypothetical protein
MPAEIHFATPIYVRFASGMTRTFQGVYDALDFLENEWPLRNGERYKRACDRCRAALQLRSHARLAREAFVSACIEAGMPVEAQPPVWQRSMASTPAAMSA